MVDTAGLRAAQDEVERLGMARTRQELQRADVVLAVHDALVAGDPALDLPDAATRVDVYNKVDLVPGFIAPAGAVAVSARTGAGLAELRAAILRAAGWTSTGESLFLARERHLRALTAAADHLRQAAAQHTRWELFAEELRLAHEELSRITGAFSADDLLGEIFSRFCIGK
jgi:tRNA modification GTPase